MKINLNIYVVCLVILFLISNYFDLLSSNEEKLAKVTFTDNEKIILDGLINDSIWNKALIVNDFLQKDPNEGNEITGKVDIRFLYDEHFLYIAATMSHKDEVRATTSRRDEAGNSERIIFSFDTYKDNRTAYSFGVTATGVRIDYSHQNDAEYNRDYSYNPIWEAKTIINDSSWSAEIRIPFNQLRFNDITEQIWGLNINWWIPSLREDAYWVVVPKNESGWSSKMGKLTGINNIQSTSRVEFLPYLAGSLVNNPLILDGNPFHNKLDYDVRAGLDFKMGLFHNFTLDATINPDFGQVEADPADVNLTAYETFFDEKRPFFIEGKQLLQGYGSSFFYSRRIGQKPKLSAVGKFTDNPSNSLILGAAKITSRNQDGLSIGALTAITGKEYAKSSDSIGGTINESAVSPLSVYNVFRIKKELSQEQISSIGLLLTNVYRDLGDNHLSRFYTKNAFTGDADWFFRFDSSTYQLDGHFGFSHISGSQEVIASIQKNSAHYFQRPDAEHLTLDTNETSLLGLTGLLKMSKIAGGHWLWEVNGGFVSPELELNDIGQFHKADLLFTYGLLKYRENKPNQLFHSYQISANYYSEWDFGFNDLIKKITLSPSMTFLNRSTLNSGFWVELPAFSKDKTRGGPLMATYTTTGGMIEYTSDWTANNQMGIYSEANMNELEGWDFQLILSGTLKLYDRVQISLKPKYLKSINPQQYINTFDNGRIETYNKRYVFAKLDLQNISLQIRMNFAITPDFTLEYYIEPYITAGKFSEFAELRKPKTYDLLAYGTEGTEIEFVNDKYIVRDGNSFDIANPDFNYLSFRSNLVLRWEITPGSTAYLVWQQNKENFESYYEKPEANSLWDAYNRTGINTLALKFSYWIPVD